MNQMHTSSHEDHIAQALAVSGGYLFLGRGGFCLHFARGATLSGYDCDTMKSACIAAGLPVIDARHIDYGPLLELVFHGPMVAVGHDPDPQPWYSLSYAPLEVVAASYAYRGAEVWNLAHVEGSETRHGPGSWS